MSRVLLCQPIGIIKNLMPSKFDAPHQPLRLKEAQRLPRASEASRGACLVEPENLNRANEASRGACLVEPENLNRANEASRGAYLVESEESGRAHTASHHESAHESQHSESPQNIIELYPGQNFETALTDLEGFEYIWLIWWFHRNETWRPRVLPPRGPAQRRGLFATRSPHRPNPIGISAVRLHSIKGRKIWVGHTDLIDGTPILDIKPYLPRVDAFPDSRAGWIDELDTYMAAPPAYHLELSELAKEQLAWLEREWDVTFFERAAEILRRDPSPHRTRRIRRRKNGNFQIGCGSWKLLFSVSGDLVTVIRVAIGYPPRMLTAEGYDQIVQRDAQVAFESIWPGEE
jgi:tRNA (adenine37-N6)-methyltransferase